MPFSTAIPLYRYVDLMFYIWIGACESYVMYHRIFFFKHLKYKRCKALVLVAGFPRRRSVVLVV